MTTPTWRLVLDAARRLNAQRGEFRLQDIVRDVQRVDPARDRSAIQPVVQGMTVNAGNGPPSPCGQPLVRIAHGTYTLSDSGSLALRENSPHNIIADYTREERRLPAGDRARRTEEVEHRVRGVIAEFPACLVAYDRQVPFTRNGQYEWHRATIDRRRQWPNLHHAITDEALISSLYQTLQKWGIGRRASHLVPLPEFRRLLFSSSDALAALERLTIDDPELQVASTAEQVWSIIEHLDVVDNVSRIVPGTKILHHLLPDLVPPMDRAWTGKFFAWSVAAPQYYQRRTFTNTFSAFARIAQATRPASYVGPGWRTSRSKLLDNAIIGYCIIHGV